MDGINKKYGIVLETLTPLAIGAGAEKDWMEGMDYVVKDGYLYRLNLPKMAQEGLNLSLLTTYFERKDSKGLLQLIGNKLDKVSDFKMPMPCETANDVKSFVKNQLTGKPIVPGSSIKGAIRSILLENFTRNVPSEMKTAEMKAADKEDGTNFMRFVKLGDFEFDHTELVNTKIFNLHQDGSEWIGGWKHRKNNTTTEFRANGFNTVYEVVAPQMQGIGYLMLTEDGFKKLPGVQSYAEEKGKTLANAPTALFKIINDHTRAYLVKEQEFFKKYTADNRDYILDNISELLNDVEQAQKDNSYCIFKMAAGSGFHSITGDWQFDDYSIDEVDTSKKISRGLHNGKKSSKSRKIAISGDGKTFSLMGFVKMSVMTAGQAAEIDENRREKIRQQEIKAEERKQAAEDARKQAEIERLQKEAEAKRQREYEVAIKKAEENFAAINQEDLQALENALTLFKDAAEIQPQEALDLHSTRIEEIERLIVVATDKSAQDDATQAFIKAGLAVLDAKNAMDEYKVKAFKQVQNNVKSWLKKSHNTTLPSEQDQYLVRTLCRLATSSDNKKERESFVDFSSPVWKEITGWCGAERAKAIFDSVAR